MKKKENKKTWIEFQNELLYNMLVSGFEINQDQNVINMLKIYIKQSEK